MVKSFPYKNISTYLFLLPFGAAYFSVQPVLLSTLLFVQLYFLAVYDLHTMRLPNVLNAVLFFSGLLYVWQLKPWLLGGHMIGAAVGAAFPIILNIIYSKLRGISGMGMGDAKLLGAAGMWLGWYHLPYILLVASVTALIYTLGQHVLKKGVTLQSRIAFGPFICCGIWAVWVIF